MYYIYHIKGVKIGVSTEPEIRVKRQGYSEFEILECHTDIYEVSKREIELQKQYGYPVDTIPYHMSRNNWGSKAGKNGGKAPTYSQRKLTYEQAQKVRAEYKLGNISQRKLAKKYGVDRDVISKIIRKQTYTTP